MNLIYLHTPKCAGTTMITSLRQVYGTSLYHDMDFRQTRRRHVAWPWQIALPLKKELLSAKFRGVKCIGGHFTWKKYAHLGWPMFVFLRNPVDQVTSQYSSGQNRDKAGFDWFVRKGANSISRMVGKLDRYFFVGIQEHLEESMRMLEWYAGIKFEWPLPHRNKSEEGFYKRDKYRPTPEQQRLIKEVNQEDMKLYSQARVRFYEQRREYAEAKEKAEETALQL